LGFDDKNRMESVVKQGEQVGYCKARVSQMATAPWCVAGTGRSDGCGLCVDQHFDAQKNLGIF
jgi:hypothetical protein